MNSGATGASRYPTQAARKAKRAEEKRRRLETPEIRAAREAREELEKCSAERDEECIYADLARRLDLRERYWTAFETWVRCQRIVEQMKCDKKLRLAVGPDVQIKVDEDIVTAEGYNDLKREVLVLYTMEHSDYLYQRDWCGDAWFGFSVHSHRWRLPETRQRPATPRRRRRGRESVATPRRRRRDNNAGSRRS